MNEVKTRPSLPMLVSKHVYLAILLRQEGLAETQQARVI